MRKRILLLMALCLHIAARGQTGHTYDYWFDNDHNTLQSGSSASDNWRLQIDVSDLQEAFHTIHLQVQDAEGNHSSPVTRYFIKTNEPTASSGRYWFDDDVQNMYSSNQVQGMMDIDVSQLSEGFHSIHYQVLGKKGNISATATQSFYKVYMSSKSSWRCWFDNDQSTIVSGDDMSQTLLLNVDKLSDGYHVIHIQADGGAQSQSPPLTKSFIKIPQTIGVENFTCLCMIDDQLFKQEKVPAGGGVIGWDFDVTQLSQGFHRIFIQIVTPSGAASNTWQSFFLRETTHSEFEQMSCVYAIDGAEFYAEAGTLADGTFHFNLDVSSLEDGLHRITYMLNNGNGVTTQAQTQFFMKTPLGGNGIVEYWYWLNEQGDEMANKVSLSERQDPFSLITLLPVESQPIRSSLFKFAMVNNQPTIYAMNDLHLRFYDASGRFSDITKQFVDESVKQDVTDIKELLQQQTLACPAYNEIKWYTFEAMVGDTVAFKTDLAACVDVFSASGEKVYATSGFESTRYSGIHTKEKGIYYLALHDVCGKAAENVTLSFFHLSRYAVVAHTPESAGIAKGSNFTMHLVGNGFDKIVDAVLTCSTQDIRMDSLLSNSISAADIRFYIASDSCTKSKYDLKLTFADENDEREVLYVRDAIKLENADYANIRVEMQNKSNIRPYPLSVILKNEGNMTYSYIPLNIAWDNPQQASDVVFKNFYAIVAAENDSLGYQPIVYTNNLLGKGVDGAMMFFFIPELGPHEVKELQLGFSAPARAHFNIYAWTGVPLELDTLTLNAQPSREPRRANTRNTGRNILTFGDHMEQVTGSRVMPGPVQRAGQVANNAIKIGATIGSMQNAMGRNLARQQIEALGGNWEDYKDVYEQLYPEVLTPGQIIGGDAGEAVDRLMGTQRNCAEEADPDPNLPYHGHIAVPVDPNDIIGYTSESGSKYMRDDVEEISYIIEFENDPKLADASAHTVIVTDTLDASRFDLSTFAPTSVKIGDKLLELDGTKQFVGKSMDLRPEIDAIAQVSLSFDEQKGIARWTIESLDPMSMEPTLDAMQGVLPVNVNGNGLGELTFDIKLRHKMIEGESVSNRAGIVFDQEAVIMTPTWTNVVDATAPLSSISDILVDGKLNASIYVKADDGLSQPWKFDLYVQEFVGDNWMRKAVNIPVDSVLQIKIEEGIDYGFYIVMTDSAGNIEQKEAMREFSLKVGEMILKGDVNGDGQVGIADIVAVTGYMAGTNTNISLASADVNGDNQVGIADIVAITDIMAGTANMRSRQNARYKTYFVKRKE